MKTSLPEVVPAPIKLYTIVDFLYKLQSNVDANQIHLLTVCALVEFVTVSLVRVGLEAVRLRAATLAGSEGQ